MCGCWQGCRAWLLVGGACVVGGGACLAVRGWGLRRIRRDTVNERAVRILLECILVFIMCYFISLFQFAVDYLARILFVDTLHFKYSTYRFSPSQPNMGSVVYSAPEPEQVISPTEADVLTDLPNGNHFELRPTNHSPAFTFESQTDSGFETGSQVRLIRQGSSVTTSCMMTHNRERTGIALEQFAGEEIA